MDFAFTAEQETLRQEVHAFLSSEVPQDRDFNPDMNDEDFAFERQFSLKLADKGWLCVGWPKEYGGGGWTHLEQAIFSEAMGYWRVPNLNGIALGMAGPALIVFGTHEQKAKYLPGITSGHDIWAQLFTEPNSGSDLASLQTRAVEDGDDYVISGQKTFITYGHRANRFYTAARTDPDAPKHRGITLFMLDPKQPGVNIRPLFNLGGTRQNEVYLDEVRVPKENMLGEKNRGWYHMAVTLDFERSGVGGPAGMRRTLEEVVAFCRETKVLGQPIIAKPAIRQRLAEISIELEIYRLLCWRVAWMQGQGLVPSYQASICNLANKEISPKWGNMLVDIFGQYATLVAGAKWAPLRGRMERAYRGSFFTHGQGAPNIQRNIIAQRGLGLPR